MYNNAKEEGYAEGPTVYAEEAKAAARNAQKSLAVNRLADREESELITELRYLNELVSDNYFAVDEASAKFRPLRVEQDNDGGTQPGRYEAIHDSQAGGLIREIAEKLQHNTRTLRTLTKETRI